MRKLLRLVYKEHHNWETYESEFLALMERRRIGDKGLKRTIANGCLLCSEDKPEHCHRRLVAEYLRQSWGDVDIVHLV